jgi:predicted amidohydrolase YtcJ
MVRLSAAACLLSLLLAACSPAPAVDPATMVLRGGKVVTVDPATPEAQAVAIAGDRIVAVGTDQDIAKYVGPGTEVIDLAGRTAVPGFIESHGHFTGLGQSKMTLDLMDATSWEQIVTMVGDAAKQAKPGDWIQGRGWHQEKWTSRPEPNVEGFPLHDALSKASPDNPVILTHASGHASFVNARAMALAGLTATTADPPGGEILKDKAGRPTGLLRETASGLVSAAFGTWRAAKTPEERTADARRQVELANQEALSKGVTSFQDAGVGFDTVDLYKQIAEEGKMGVRLWVMVRETPEVLRAKLPAYKIKDLANHHLTVGGIKLQMDGALGSRGAWLLAPYADLPTSTGLNTTPIPVVEETARIAMEHGVQLCVHAIGDRANRETLNVFEAAFKANPAKQDLRWRIEHAQHLDAADIPRFGQLGVIAAMQGIHCTSDAPYVLERLGQARAEAGAYVWQKLAATGAVISNGTDTPVERVDPIASYHATVSRTLKNGSVFFGDQKLSRADALKTYTLNGAYAAFEESVKGSITPGKLADVTVLSKDILTIPEAEIPSTEVVYTIVGGKVRYRGKGAAGTN